jgi:nucleotide-binding universal stress UspA family protein
MNDIVVGVDRSETAARAAVVAAEMASALGVNLHLVTCAEKSGSSDLRVGSDVFHTDWMAQATAFLDDAARRLDHDQVTTMVGSGNPATVLSDEARRLDARMIVVGNRRVQGLARVLGSVAGDVLRHADCDVLIVDTTD